MGRKPTAPDGALETGLRMVASATTLADLRTAQAVLLPLLGLSLKDTARAIGKDRYWVSRQRNRALEGRPIGPHGGRRHSLIPVDDEVALVSKALLANDRVWMANRLHARPAIRAAVDASLPEPASEAAISDLMDRVAHKLMPGLRGADLERWGVTVIRLIEHVTFRQREAGDDIAG